MYNTAFMFQLGVLKSPTDFLYVNVSSLTLFQIAEAKGQQKEDQRHLPCIHTEYTLSSV